MNNAEGEKMSIGDDLRVRLNEIVQQGERLSVGNEHGQIKSDQHVAECRGWLAAAKNAVDLICSPDNSYFEASSRIVEKSANQGFLLHTSVGDLNAVLTNLIVDVDRGLIGSIIRQAQAEAFDDLLDLADRYFDMDHKEGAGIISSAVFEDTLRKIGISNEIDVEKIDELISAIAKKNVINSILAKRCRAAADVRNNALHAKWDDYKLNDAKIVIDLSRELIREYLVV
jgi:hypothetical protein